jgi:large subunit ribosomal protein L5
MVENTYSVPVLLQNFRSTISKKIQEELSLTNVHLIPKLDKIVVNVGFGQLAADKKKIDKIVEELALITGQRPVITKAKKSIASFKVREGMSLGCKVTLRKNKMYEFLDRLVNIALPRVKDFRGLSSKSFDKGSNYSFGLKDHTIFQEISYDKVDFLWGMDITICIRSQNVAGSKALLTSFNFPFVN